MLRVKTRTHFAHRIVSVRVIITAKPQTMAETSGLAIVMTLK
jgi:hypothetical protein